mgnify:CR=1 FL=1
MNRDALVFSVYDRARELDLRMMLESLREVFEDRQTDVWAIIDGPVGLELQGVIESYQCVGMLVLPIERNLGLGGALNMWFKDNQNYRYIFRIDTDDRYVEGRITDQRRALDANHLVAAHSGAIEYRYGTRRKVRESYSCHALSLYTLFRSPMNHPASAIRGEALASIDGFPVFRTAQDLVLWHRLLNAGWSLQSSKKIMVRSEIDHNLLSRRGARALLADMPAYRDVIDNFFPHNPLAWVVVGLKFCLAVLISLIQCAYLVIRSLHKKVQNLCAT